MSIAVDWRFSGGQETKVFAQALRQAWDESAAIVEAAQADACGPDGCEIP
ncbi:MAG: hypothetical protein AAB214_20475 [Fibrobacterota bacterium]